MAGMKRRFAKQALTAHFRRNCVKVKISLTRAI
jgi:hypothetical protein